MTSFIAVGYLVSFALMVGAIVARATQPHQIRRGVPPQRSYQPRPRTARRSAHPSPGGVRMRVGIMVSGQGRNDIWTVVPRRLLART